MFYIYAIIKLSKLQLVYIVWNAYLYQHAYIFINFLYINTFKEKNHTKIYLHFIILFSYF